MGGKCQKNKRTGKTLSVSAPVSRAAGHRLDPSADRDSTEIFIADLSLSTYFTHCAHQVLSMEYLVHPHTNWTVDTQQTGKLCSKWQSQERKPGVSDSKRFPLSYHTILVPGVGHCVRGRLEEDDVPVNTDTKVKTVILTQEVFSVKSNSTHSGLLSLRQCSNLDHNISPGHITSFSHRQTSVLQWVLTKTEMGQNMNFRCLNLPKFKAVNSSFIEDLSI